MTAIGHAASLHPVNCSEPAGQVLRRHGKSFHFAGRFLSPVQLEEASRLYAFCRYADDIADLSPHPDTAREQLDRISRDLRDGHSDLPIVAEFLAMARRCLCDLEVAQQLLLGLRNDAGEVCVQDDAGLKQYCYRVAGTVGILMCDILGARDPAARRFAVDLGIGMQLTNIARDLCEDAARGRRYLPVSLAPDLRLEEIAEGSEDARPALREAVRALLREADRYYQSGEAGLAYLPARPRLAILVAARVYHAIGTRLARRGFRVWEGRAVVSTPSKVWIAGRAIAAYFGQGMMRRLPAHHDAALHEHLQVLPGLTPPDEGTP